MNADNFDLLLWITIAVVSALGWMAFARHRDGFHPAVFFAPLFAFFYGLWPLLLNSNGEFYRFFDSDDLEYVAFLNLAALAALFGGMVTRPAYAVSARSGRFTMPMASFPPGSRDRMFTVSIVFGVVASLAYWYGLENVGGFADAYGRVKGGGYIGSGYISESVMLAYPAIALLAISRQGRRIRASDVAIAILMVSPHLLQGTFGGRRGPLFLSLASLFFAWYLAKSMRPSVKASVIGVAAISLAVAIVFTNRQDVYLGSGQQIELSRTIEKLFEQAPDSGNEYLTGAATIRTADHFDDYYWGRRYFVTFLIRPIPKQVWPTKYQDMGANWIRGADDDEYESRFSEALGFNLIAGSSTGFIADVYAEFSWGVVLFSFALGRLLSVVYWRNRLLGGLWTILFLEMMVLGIYLPTQSFTAWGHRVLIMGVATYAAWRWFIERSPGRKSGPIASMARDVVRQGRTAVRR